MYLLGHTNSSFTMGVYQQVLDMGGAAVEQLEELLGADLDEAGATFSGRGAGSSPGEAPRRARARRLHS